MVTFHFDQVNVYCVCKQNNRPSDISRLDSLLVGLAAGTYQNYAMKLLWKIMRFLVYLYYTQPFYWTSTFGQNHAYSIRILTVYTFIRRQNTVKIQTDRERETERQRDRQTNRQTDRETNTTATTSTSQ